MLFQYFSETDMLYIELAQGVAVESEEVAPGVVLDFNDKNQIIGLEIEDASQFIDLSQLTLSSLPLSNLVFSSREPVVQ